jgi:hypothetical protein
MYGFFFLVCLRTFDQSRNLPKSALLRGNTFAIVLFKVDFRPCFTSIRLFYVLFKVRKPEKAMLVRTIYVPAQRASAATAAIFLPSIFSTVATAFCDRS